MEAPLRTILFLLPLFLAATVVHPSLFDTENNVFNLPFPSIDNAKDDGPGDSVKQVGGGQANVSNEGAGGGRRRRGASARDFQTEYNGAWELFSENTGVSAMHLVITHLNKAIMFDATNFGPSKLPLSGQPCRFDERTKETDCYAHALEFDIETAEIRPLNIKTNPWCASGAMAPDGTLVQTGGWWEGGNAVRYLGACATCDWTEYRNDLFGKRWYATQQILPDGSFIVIGGRRQFNYEYVPPPGKPNKFTYDLPLLSQTNDKELENNLYPYVHLSTDGNLFVFANDRSILLDPRTNKVVREFPQLMGGARNYPNSGMSALLPIDLNRPKGKTVPAEVIVCGGGPPQAAKLAGQGTFNPALGNCARMIITNANARWQMEMMPKPRIMADLLILPTADMLFINGASKGAAGWLFARDPVFEPWLYRPLNPRAQRFKVLSPSTIPRLYHSTSAVLPDGKILVAGSNPNNGYNYTGVMYPTELRVEKFTPPYLDPSLAEHRPEVTQTSSDKVTYGQSFQLVFKLPEPIYQENDIKVTMYAPPFTTHGYSMNQRLLILRSGGLGDAGSTFHKVTVTAPPSAVFAPPGYYLVFVVYRGVPSKGIWIRVIQ